MKKIVIVGGGASGMTAAIAAAKENPAAKIRILERKDLPGKKILSTGNGRCNFTNQVMHMNCFFSDTPNGIEEVLQQFGTKETLDVFSDLGILPKDRNGYYYPRSDQASSIVSVLRTRLQQAGVEVETNVYVTGLKKTKKGFLISADGKKYEADAVILACGGKAAPALGSDGSGYDLAKSMGHHMVPVVPALVQLKVDRFALKAAAGVRTDAEVSFYEDGAYIAKDQGEVQITAYGLSGIPIFQISRCAAKALYYHKNAVVHLDLIPQMDQKELLGFLTKRMEQRQMLTMSKFLIGIFNQKLIPCILRYAGIREQTKVSELSKTSFSALLHACKNMEFVITDTNGFEHAQVCAGGIRFDEVSHDTMESLCCKNLYLAGELLDVDGICGGYNLQWAWASGYLAGTAAGRLE